MKKFFKKIWKWLDDDSNIVFLCVLVGEITFLLMLLIRTFSLQIAVL